MARDSDELAIERYRYLLRTAPPEEIERAHAEAFAALTPEQRRKVIEGLASTTPESELAAAGDDPDRLARVATRAELREPGTMERVYGQMPARGGFLGGLGFGGTFLNTLAGAFVGTAIANTLFDSYGYPPGDPAGPDSRLRRRWRRRCRGRRCRRRRRRGDGDIRRRGLRRRRLRRRRLRRVRRVTSRPAAPAHPNELAAGLRLTRRRPAARPSSWRLPRPTAGQPAAERPAVEVRPVPAQRPVPRASSCIGLGCGHVRGLELVIGGTLLGREHRQLRLDEVLADTRVVQVEEDQQRQEPADELGFHRRTATEQSDMKPKISVKIEMKMPKLHA